MLQNNENKPALRGQEHQMLNYGYLCHRSAAHQAHQASIQILSQARRVLAGSLWPSCGQTFWSEKQKNQRAVDVGAQSPAKEARA